jgi:chemotaxis protein CheX
MPEGLTVPIVPGELAEIVESVFAAMTSLEVVECGTPWFAGGDRLTSAIHLAGDWNGALLLECDRSQACRLAGRFLSIDIPETVNPETVNPETVNDDVRDVLGELANMIGGNLKSILGSGIRLSMPSVVDGSSYSLRVCGAEVRESLAFQCSEGLFWVTVLATRS